MLQLRPTFSESWYRVAALKPRLRAGAQISRQFYRGERWYVVRDPAGNQFHRLSDPAYRFIGLLNGRRTVSEAWDLVGGQLADDAPTQPEVIQILTQLYSANLLETDITPDATVLLRRHKQMNKRKMQNRLMNVLFPRIPLWDPDRFLKLWMPVARVLFSKIGALIWLAVVGFAVATVLPQWSQLQSAANHALDMQHNLENLFYLYAVFVVIKLIHELGHAFACRRFGGECHELGVMFLVCVPTPYVDASTAWSFSSKWQRIFVGAAGMIVELFFASICAFIWRYTNEANYPLIKELAYNAMFIASVSTIIFNANPLLRYDGYYILSDLLEIPNLRQRSTEYAMGLIKRHIFQVKGQQSLPSVGQRIWLLFYALASGAYRAFVGIAIIVLVTYKIPVLGVLMAIGGVITWLFVPLFQVSKYLLLDPELHRKRIRAIVFSASVAAAVVILVGLVPFSVHVEFAGIVQPHDPVNADGLPISGILKAGEDGRVSDALRARDGQLVKAGDVILELIDPIVDHDIKEAAAQIDAVEIQIRNHAVTDQNRLEQDREQLSVWREKLASAQERQERLKIKAPFAGRLIAPKLRELPNTFLARGDEIGEVAVLDRLMIKGNIDQTDAQLLLGNAEAGTARELGRMDVEVRLAGQLARPIPGGSVTVLPAASQDLAHPSLGQLGGGEGLIDPRDPKGLRSQVPEFEAHIDLENPNEMYFAGQRAYVRFTLEKKPLAWQWTRRFWQILESKDNGKWL